MCCDRNAVGSSLQKWQRQGARKQNDEDAPTESNGQIYDTYLLAASLLCNICKVLKCMLMLSPFYNICNVKFMTKAAAVLNDHAENYLDNAADYL